MSKNINEMNYYKLSKEVHANAVAKGFWDEPHRPNHYFMLSITEVTESVEAHRKGRTASIPEGMEDFPDEDFIPSFEAHIKDTLEDELADTQIRLLDIYGGIIEKKEDTPDITEEVDENYMSSRDIIESPEEFIWNPLQKVFDGLCLLRCLSEHFDIDLERHVRLKVRYNATRPRLHGKKY